MGLHDPRVGKDAQQGAQLLEVLRRLEQPAPRPAQPLERLEHAAQVPVGGRLIGRAVPVAVARDEVARLEQHRREGDREQLDLLVARLGLHLVHQREERHRPVQEAQALGAAPDARIGLAAAGADRERRGIGSSDSQ